jgi:hypothetical protein
VDHLGELGGGESTNRKAHEVMALGRNPAEIGSSLQRFEAESITNRNNFLTKRFLDSRKLGQRELSVPFSNL